MANESVTVRAVYLLPGMKAQITIPRVDANPNNAFAKTGTVTSELGEERTLQNGFYVEDEDVGEITEVLEDMVGIVYLHKKAEENTIWFLDLHDQRKGKVEVIAVPIHDHSSIVQGGPAFGTFFSDAEED